MLIEARPITLVTQDRLQSLVEERKKLVEEDGAGGGKGHASIAYEKSEVLRAKTEGEMIEKEKHKLEVLKRRQERDIQQVGGLL